MKITGTSSYVKFDLENGYIAKAEGELLVGKKFVVYTNSMKYWEPPFDKTPITQKDITSIKNMVQNQENSKTVKLIFE